MYEQLLDQAEHLAGVDPQRPRQVNLRRALSAAYYAMFHFVVDQATHYFISATGTGRDLRQLMARGFEHAEMRDASRAFRAGQLPHAVQQALGNQPIPVPLRRFAATFVEAQERRHKADYDLSANFVRQAVQTEIGRVRKAIRDWDRVQDDPATRVFLLSVLMWSRIKRR